MSERKKVMAEATSVSIDYESIDSVIERLQELRVQYKGLKTEFRYVTYDYSEDKYLALFVERDETDAEMERRIKQELDYKSYQDQRDKLEFERLKAKFKGV